MTEACYIILLRGVNVGGSGKIAMAELRESLSNAGFTDVKTYIQTGNIVLNSRLNGAEALVLVQDIIEETFGFRPKGISLTAVDLDQAIQRNPFAVADKKLLHLIFLSDGAQLDVEGLKAFCTADEEFHLQDDIFYLSTPNGYGRSKAAEKLDKFLIADVKTARNLNSCEKILALANSV